MPYTDDALINTIVNNSALMKIDNSPSVPAQMSRSG